VTGLEEGNAFVCFADYAKAGFVPTTRLEIIGIEAASEGKLD
jgi:hypothetical protein